MPHDSERLRAVKDLICDTVEGTTNLVESTQDSVADSTLAYLSLVQGLGGPARRVDQVRRAITGLVTGSVRTTNEIVRRALDVAAPLIPSEPNATPTPMRFDQPKDPRLAADALLGVLNGLLGDYLREQSNALDLGMQLRFEDRYFDADEAPQVLAGGGEKLALFIHGLMATEVSWTLNAESAWGDPTAHYGRKLAADLGYTPLFLRYNSGPHISENGRALATLLSDLHEQLPATTELVLIGHSLGGLIARSATHYESQRQAPSGWLDRLSNVVTLGSPHLGSPVANGGHFLTAGLDAIDFPATQVIATIAKRRSAAIKDLRTGYIVDEDWHGKDPDAWLSAPRSDVAFVDDVTYMFVGSTVSADPDATVGRAIGDLLVRLPSATQQSEYEVERHVIGGLDHLRLQNDPQIYELIRARLA